MTVSDYDFISVLSRFQNVFDINGEMYNAEHRQVYNSAVFKIFSAKSYLSDLKDQFFKVTSKNSGRVLCYHRLIYRFRPA